MDALIVHETDPVVLVGGADLGPDELNIFQSRAPIYVGVDRGADHLLAAGLCPSAVIGDLDSLSDAARARFADVLHPVMEQETVDFEKALVRVQAPLIYAVGFWGGRVDHSLAVLNVLGRYADRRIVLVGPEDVSMVIPRGEVTLALPKGCRVSLMPLCLSMVTTKGMRWDITDYEMDTLGKCSPSNESAAEKVQITTQGAVVLSLPRSQIEQLAHL